MIIQECVKDQEYLWVLQSRLLKFGVGLHQDHSIGFSELYTVVTRKHIKTVISPQWTRMAFTSTGIGKILYKPNNLLKQRKFIVQCTLPLQSH